MAKYYGKVGYSETVEMPEGSGVWVSTIVERHYYGDVIRNMAKNVPGVSLNNDIHIENRISILADPYAYQNFSNIKYVEWMGNLWVVSSIEVQRPRLILSIGGVYNGETPSGTSANS